MCRVCGTSLCPFRHCRCPRRTTLRSRYWDDDDYMSVLSCRDSPAAGRSLRYLSRHGSGYRSATDTQYLYYTVCGLSRPCTVCLSVSVSVRTVVCVLCRLYLTGSGTLNDLEVNLHTLIHVVAAMLNWWTAVASSD